MTRKLNLKEYKERQEFEIWKYETILIVMNIVFVISTFIFIELNLLKII